MSDVQIIPVENKDIVQQQNVMYYSNNRNNTLTMANQTYYVNGGQPFSVSQPYCQMNGKKLQFQFNTGQFAVSQFNSYLQYDGQFGVRFKKAGRYIMKQGFWYFQEPNFTGAKSAIIVGSATATTDPIPYTNYNYAGKPLTAICLAPYNSCCVLDNSKITYSKIDNKNEDISQHSRLYQAQIGNDFQNSHNQTWFGGDEASIIFEFIPQVKLINADSNQNLVAGQTLYFDSIVKMSQVLNASQATIKALYQTADIITKSIANFQLSNSSYTQEIIATTKQIDLSFYHSFTIPMNLLNTYFDVDGSMIYLNALSQGLFIFELGFQKYFFGKIYGLQIEDDATNGFLLENYTGIVNAPFRLLTKNDDAFKSDLEVQNIICSQLQNYDIYSIATRQPATGNVNERINTGHVSVNDLVICLNTDDSANADSALLKQRFTLFSADQLINIENKIYDNTLDALFLCKFNIIRNAANDKMFSDDVCNLQQFKEELFRSLNLNNRQRLLTHDFDSPMQLLKSFAVCWVSMEAYKLDLCPDVIYDGLSTTDRAPLLNWYLSNYKEYQQQGSENQKRYASADCSNKCKLESDTYACNVFQLYDAFAMINPANSSSYVSENPMNE